MLGIINPFPRLGPFPKFHHLGMLQAIMAVMRSMEKGRGRDGLEKYGTYSPDAGADITLASASIKG